MEQEARVGEVVNAEVFRITNFGAFVKLPHDRKGLIHISQISDDYVKDINDHLKIGDKVKARIIAVTEDGKIDLSLKEQIRRPHPAPRVRRPKRPNNFLEGRRKEFKFLTFEEKMKEFLKKSQERQYDLKGNIDSKRGR